MKRRDEGDGVPGLVPAKDLNANQIRPCVSYLDLLRPCDHMLDRTGADGDG
jgi:hypothetical protein